MSQALDSFNSILIKNEYKNCRFNEPDLNAVTAWTKQVYF